MPKSNSVTPWLVMAPSSKVVDLLGGDNNEATLIFLSATTLNIKLQELTWQTNKLFGSGAF